MAVNTYLLDFTVGEETLGSLPRRHTLMDAIEVVLSENVPEMKSLRRISVTELDNGFLLITASGSIVASIRGYPEGVITVNIEHFRQNLDAPLFTVEKLRSIVAILENVVNGEKGHALPAIKRGTYIDRYFLSADERILEYDVDKVVFEQQSPYQKVQIVHSKSLGNLLVLDELQNMSESDLIYTETLMQRGIQDYKDKEIIILGGGDGCLLWELLKEDPKFVWMLELDEVVMKACSVHLRSSCGNCLDNYNGKRYEIIVGDCFKTLNKFIDEGKKVDYVFGDLTDIPVDSSGEQDAWDFIDMILNKSMQVLKPGGIYLTHGNGSSVPESLQAFEGILNRLKPSVKYTKTHAFIPSFLEDWIFYQVKPQH